MIEHAKALQAQWDCVCTDNELSGLKSITGDIDREKLLRQEYVYLKGHM